jgi:hypothetical protein
MRTLARLACLTLLAACGGPPHAGSTDAVTLREYRAGCLVFTSSLALSQAALERNATAAADVMQPHVGDFCAAFDGMPILVVPGELFPCADPRGCRGTYSPFTGVTTVEDNYSLVHELFHAWDARHFAPGTLLHSGWDSNGYDVAIEEFRWRARLGIVER